MKTFLHKSLLYIAVYIIIAAIFNMLICKLPLYIIPELYNYSAELEIASFLFALVFVILFVRCRPLNRQEKEDSRYFRFHLLS